MGLKISEVGDLKTIAAGDLIEIERPGTPDESHHAALGTAAGKDTGTGSGDVATGNHTHSGVYEPADADLTAIAGLSSNGLVARTGSGTAAVRSVASGAGISVTNGDGVSGNPTVAIDKATAAEFRNDTADHVLTPDNVWDAAESVSLTDDGTVTVSLAALLSSADLVLGGNRTLDFTNPKEGQHFVIKVTATGGTRTLTMDSIAKLWTGVETGPYSITTSQVLYVCGFVSDGGTIEITAIGRRGA
jgi:hypothetical protein